jgi:PLD-like domain
MVETGMQPEAAAYTLEMLATSITRRPLLGEVIDLVTTGPPSTVNGSRDTGVVVSELFRKAQKSVLVAGYAVYQGQRVFQSLAERMSEHPDVKVKMFLDIQRGPGDTTSEAELVRRFAHRFKTSEWPMGKPLPEIFYDPRAMAEDRRRRAVLHAKCVVIDDEEVFVSSANFTQAAQERMSKWDCCFIPP